MFVFVLTKEFSFIHAYFSTIIFGWLVAPDTQTIDVTYTTTSKGKLAKKIIHYFLLGIVIIWQYNGQFRTFIDRLNHTVDAIKTEECDMPNMQAISYAPPVKKWTPRAK